MCTKKCFLHVHKKTTDMHVHDDYLQGQWKTSLLANGLWSTPFLLVQEWIVDLNLASEDERKIATQKTFVSINSTFGFIMNKLR